MKRFVSLSVLSTLLAFAPAAGFAQTSPTVPLSDYGPITGNYEFTLGGSGFGNKDLDSTGGGLSASIGKYITNTLLVSVRQSVNYSNPSPGGKAYNGSTLVAIDQHFGTGPIRPFAGINLGGIYGDNTYDSWSAGVEGGVKFYVQPRTFLFAMAQYEWRFRKGSQIDDSFSNGQYGWNVGVGFHF